MYKFRFRKFQVYKDALIYRRELKILVFRCFPNEERYILVDQILRAATSIVLNIAEGSNRNTDKDFANFLNIANTSLDEVVSCLDIALIEKYITKEVHEKYVNKAIILADQLTAFRRKILNDSKKR